jgi:hypothetical protein
MVFNGATAALRHQLGLDAELGLDCIRQIAECFVTISATNTDSRGRSSCPGERASGRARGGELVEVG